MAPNSVRSVDVASTAKEASIGTRNASTIGELISTIPQTWRPALAVQLNAVHRVAAKLCNVQNTIAQYDRHAAEGSFPASIRNSIRDPKIQYSKEYLGTLDGAEQKSLLEAHIKQSRKELLKFARTRKNEEMTALQGQISWDPVKWRTIVADTAKRAAQTVNVSVAGSTTSDVAPVWTGTAPPALKEECALLWAAGSTFHYKAISIARSAADRLLVEKTKSLSLKAVTDHEMKDVDVEKTTRQVVIDEMQSQMRLLKNDLVRSLGQARKPAPKQKKGKKGGSNQPSGVRKGRAQKSGPRKNGGK